MFDRLGKHLDENFDTLMDSGKYASLADVYRRMGSALERLKEKQAAGVGGVDSLAFDYDTVIATAYEILGMDPIE